MTHQLERREKLFGAIADRSVLGIIVIDPETKRFVEFNDTACAMFGHTRTEFAALSVDDLQVVAESEPARQRLGSVLVLGRAEFENTYRLKGGCTRDFWVSCQCVHLDDHAYNATVWVDITERKRAEAALRERKELFSAIVAQALD